MMMNNNIFGNMNINMMMNTLNRRWNLIFEEKNGKKPTNIYISLEKNK